MTTRAYAKINLGLRVLGKRADGYHDLQTVFHQIDMFDEMEFRLHEHAVILSTNLPDLPPDESNLCVKAAQLLKDLTGTQDGAEMVLRKNIPLGAGLGGGSADAAMTLRSLVSLWNLDISAEEIRSLALTLGSDVPFFLSGGSAYATGRGEVLERLNLRLPHWIIVVTPAIHVSTAWAYRNLRRIEPSSASDFKKDIVEHLEDPAGLARILVNDFEQVVFESHPEIGAAKNSMLQAGAECALLSGTGSSVFGLTRSEAIAKRLMSDLAGFGRVSLTKPFFSTGTEDQR